MGLFYRGEFKRRGKLRDRGGEHQNFVFLKFSLQKTEGMWGGVVLDFIKRLAQFPHSAVHRLLRIFVRTETQEV